jgi:hypothetical protein
LGRREFACGGRARDRDARKIAVRASHEIDRAIVSDRDCARISHDGRVGVSRATDRAIFRAIARLRIGNGSASCRRRLKWGERALHRSPFQNEARSAERIRRGFAPTLLPPRLDVHFRVSLDVYGRTKDMSK